MANRRRSLRQTRRHGRQCDHHGDLQKHRGHAEGRRVSGIKPRENVAHGHFFPRPVDHGPDPRTTSSGDTLRRSSKDASRPSSSRRTPRPRAAGAGSAAWPGAGRRPGSGEQQAVRPAVQPALIREPLQHRLHRVAGDPAPCGKDLPHLADGRLAALPDDFHDFQLPLGQRQQPGPGHRTPSPTIAYNCRHSTYSGRRSSRSSCCDSSLTPGRGRCKMNPHPPPPSRPAHHQESLHATAIGSSDRESRFLCFVGASAAAAPEGEPMGVGVAKAEFGKTQGRHAGRSLHPDQRPRHEGQDHHLRRHHHRTGRARPRRQDGRRGARLRQPQELPRRRPLLRRPHRPRRQPRRQGPLHAGRQGVQAGQEQRPQRPARRRKGVRQGGVEGRAGRDEGRPGAEAELRQPGRRGGLPRQPVGDGRLHADQRRRAADRLHRRRRTRRRR